MTENYNAELYFVYLPFVGTFTENSDDERHTKIMAIVDNLGIKYIDLSTTFKTDLDDPLSMFELRKYQHLNLALILQIFIQIS